MSIRKFGNWILGTEINQIAYFDQRDKLIDAISFCYNRWIDFKVVWCLTNTFLKLENKNKKLFVYKKLLVDGYDISNDWTVELDSWVLLSSLVSKLSSLWFDGSYLRWIPWTVGGAVINNSWSWKLWLSIFDNLKYVIYYDEKWDLHKVEKKDLIFWKRFSQFKYMTNIFIDKVGLKFDYKGEDNVKNLINERDKYRKTYNKIYQSPSLWTMYIGNSYQKVLDHKYGWLVISNNKIIWEYNQNIAEDFLPFVEKLDKKYYLEKEIEIYDDLIDNQNIYTGVLFYDSNWNFIIQKRDHKKNIKNSWKYTLFGWWLEKWELIIDGMLREVYEELGISLKEEEIENRQLFIKKENMDITRCFIFVVKKNNIYDFKNQTSCNEWYLVVENIKNIQNIMSNDLYSKVLKKSLLYTFFD